MRITQKDLAAVLRSTGIQVSEARCLTAKAAQHLERPERVTLAL